MIHVTHATAADMEGIAAVIRDVWQQEMLPDVCRAQIRDNDAALWVTKEASDVVGFASGFMTTDGAGVGRWEVDLVAVRPSHQGQGLGRRLVIRMCREAEERGIPLARALISVENQASQKAFQSAGFTTDWRVQQLLVWSPKRVAPQPACPSQVLLLPVETLTYRGLWMEGLEDASATEQRWAVAAARSAIASEARHHTSAAVSVDRAELLAPAVRTQAKVLGEHYWFVRPTQEE